MTNTNKNIKTFPFSTLPFWIIVIGCLFMCCVFILAVEVQGFSTVTKNAKAVFGEYTIFAAIFWASCLLTIAGSFCMLIFSGDVLSGWYEEQKSEEECVMRKHKGCFDSSVFFVVLVFLLIWGGLWSLYTMHTNLLVKDLNQIAQQTPQTMIEKYNIDIAAAKKQKTEINKQKEADIAALSKGKSINDRIKYDEMVSKINQDAEKLVNKIDFPNPAEFDYAMDKKDLWKVSIIHFMENGDILCDIRYCDDIVFDNKNHCFRRATTKEKEINR